MPPITIRSSLGSEDFMVRGKLPFVAASMTSVKGVEADAAPMDSVKMRSDLKRPVDEADGGAPRPVDGDAQAGAGQHRGPRPRVFRQRPFAGIEQLQAEGRFGPGSFHVCPK